MIPDGRGQMQEQIDFSKTTEIKCEACEGLLVINVDMSTKNFLI